jgi:hypothetical protein
MSEKRASRYIVGIDLGTTHTVVGFVDTLRAHDAEGGQASAQTRPRIEVFQIPQLVAPGEVARRPLLPSFRYHHAESELSDADRNVGFAEPLANAPRAVVGTLAQRMGSAVPGRLVASAKSWLCHAAVDREAPILPWSAPDDVAKISPVDASASYLAHVRAAWDNAHPSEPLRNQDVVLTVPASFDEAARALTLEAAKRAGLPKLRLLEEPQAAFYDFLDRHRDTLAEDLAGTALALVVDVGGGTTDLTLIHAELRESGPRLTRIAVGDHLMLGGDNMDLTLARLSEPELAGEGQALPAARFSQLVQQCREAKEKLLGDTAPDKVSLTVLGGGSKLIGGAKSATLSAARAQEIVVDGFMPPVTLDTRPQARRSAFVEFGLPYTADPAITKHVAAFLARHRGVSAEALKLSAEEVEREPTRALPDAVLFNGGVFRSAQLRQRMLHTLGALRGAALKVLDNDEPELAVARGAVAYGLARRGVGLKIGGGSPRSYYLLVESKGEGQKGLCVLPRGAEEGEDVALTGRTFRLRVGEPVRFRLFTSTSERAHRPGELVTLDKGYHELPEIAVVLESRGDAKALEVELHAALTEVGTLEMSCVGVEDRARRYKLEFDLRAGQRASSEGPTARVGQLHPRFAEATALIQAFYGKSNKELEGRKLKTLRQDLEKILGDRDTWDTALLRELCGALLAGLKRRRRSADHERLWLHLTGYCLRPGFGYPVDAYRVDQVFAIYPEGLQFAPEAQVWSQWWILWRRIAGGLDEKRQSAIFDDLVYYLEPPGPRPKPRPKGPRAQGLDDMVRLTGALERVPEKSKVAAGGYLFERLARKEISDAAGLWAIGRLGARAPLYGSAHTVVPVATAEEWLSRALRLDLGKVDQAAFAVAQLGRLTHDRQRDVRPALRERAAQALERLGHDSWVTLVREGGELTEADRGRVFGESLPMGLVLSE